MKKPFATEYDKGVYTTTLASATSTIYLFTGCHWKDVQYKNYASNRCMDQYDIQEQVANRKTYNTTCQPASLTNFATDPRQRRVGRGAMCPGGQGHR